MELLKSNSILAVIHGIKACGSPFPAKGNLRFNYNYLQPTLALFESYIRSYNPTIRVHSPVISGNGYYTGIMVENIEHSQHIWSHLSETDWKEDYLEDAHYRYAISNNPTPEDIAFLGHSYGIAPEHVRHHAQGGFLSHVAYPIPCEISTAKGGNDLFGRPSPEIGQERFQDDHKELTKQCRRARDRQSKHRQKNERTTSKHSHRPNNHQRHYSSRKNHHHRKFKH